MFVVLEVTEEWPREVSSCQQSVQLLNSGREQLSQLHWEQCTEQCYWLPAGGREGWPCLPLENGEFSRRFLSILCSIILFVAAGRLNMGWHLL